MDSLANLLSIFTVNVVKKFFELSACIAIVSSDKGEAQTKATYATRPTL